MTTSGIYDVKVPDVVSLSHWLQFNLVYIAKVILLPLILYWLNQYPLLKNTPIPLLGAGGEVRF